MNQVTFSHTLYSGFSPVLKYSTITPPFPGPERFWMTAMACRRTMGVVEQGG